MSDAEGRGGVAPPEAFTELVRDALHHLYDPAHLQTHPLHAYRAEGAGEGNRGKRLRQALLDAIEALQPGPTAGGPHAWRPYRLLELRYLEGNEVADVLTQIALSKAQYHREHNRALEAVASILWERWHAESPSPGPSLGLLAREEVERLFGEGGVSGRSRLDPRETLREVGELLRPLATRRAVEFQWDLPDPPLPIRGERVTLRQLLLMTLAYAVETTSAGRVSVTLRRSGSCGEVAIANSAGPLAPGAELVARWQPFVEALRASYAERRGEILLSFPLGSLTLLVVDNNRDFITLVERYLQGTAWNVGGVSNAAEAIRAARAQPPTAVLLDIVIPEKDGWELLVDFQGDRATRDVPVIVCSVLAEPEVALSLGAWACLPKPVDQETLLRTLQHLERLAQPDVPAPSEVLGGAR